MTTEKRRAAYRKYYLAHREECIARSTKWLKEHRERRKEYEKAFRKKHPEKVRAKYRLAVRRWRERHPELNKERQQRYNLTFKEKHQNKSKTTTI